MSSYPPTPPEPPTPPGRPIPPAGRPTEPLARALPRQPVVERAAVEPPPDDWGSSSPWLAILIGTLALIVGGLVGYLIGHNNGTTEPRRGAAVTQTVTTTVPRVEVHTVTSKTVTQVTAPPNSAAEEGVRATEERLRKAEAENERLKQKLEEGGG